MQREFEQLREELLVLAGAIPREERSAIASYLRAGAIVFAFMEWTTDVVGAFRKPRLDRKKVTGTHILDVVGGAFDTAGGSGICTDGFYYWRADAADYVEHYGIGLPEDFLRHGRSSGWIAPPTMTEEEVFPVHEYLVKHGRRLRSANDGT